MLNQSQLRKELLGVNLIPGSVMEEVFRSRCLQIWVPKRYGGLGFRFSEGLKHLFDWSKIDGSLGWMLTLCAGANYFSRNMNPKLAEQLFADSKTCFGGSGMLGGTAERQKDGSFLINGLWHFATGAPHLSHFTLNAKLTENGSPILDTDNNEVLRSFIVSKDQVTIIPDWKSMGMKASGTFSFQIENALVGPDYSFVYDVFYSDELLDKLPFRIFADLTLLVNYLGMASHFVEEAGLIRKGIDFSKFLIMINSNLEKVLGFAHEIEGLLMNQNLISTEKQNEIHEYGVNLIPQISHLIVDYYSQLGTRASDISSPIYQVFCDYFTATMHANFRATNIN